MAHVMAGWDTMNLSRNCGQVAAPVSRAHSGRGFRSSRRMRAPWRNGRLAMTAMPRSLAKGKIAPQPLGPARCRSPERNRWGFGHDRFELAMAATFDVVMPM